MDKLLSIKDVMAWLGVSHRMVLQLIQTNHIPATRVGKLWRVKQSDVQAYLDRNVIDRDEEG